MYHLLDGCVLPNLYDSNIHNPFWSYAAARVLPPMWTTLMCMAFVCTVVLVAGCRSSLEDDPLRPTAGQIVNGGLITQEKVPEAIGPAMRTFSGFAEIQRRATTCDNEGLSALLQDTDAVWVKLALSDEGASLQVGGWALMKGPVGTAQLSLAGEMWIESVKGAPKRLCTAKSQVRMAPDTARVVLSERLSGGAETQTDCETTMEALLRF